MVPTPRPWSRHRAIRPLPPIVPRRLEPMIDLRIKCEVPDFLLRDRDMSVKKHPLYSRWKGMHKRCRFDKNYADRGIVVCDRWRSSAVFIADMAPTWFPGAMIERTDNDGPYSPENCRWATDKEQRRNKRLNVWMEYQGKRMCLADVAAQVGLDKRTLGTRLRRGILPPALFAPAQAQPAHHKVWVDTELGPMPTHHAVLFYGVPRRLLVYRLSRGKTWRDTLFDPPDRRFVSWPRMQKNPG